MEQSDQNNRLLDEQLKDKARSITQGAPVNGRVDERFREEGVGPRPGQPSADRAPADRQAGTSEGLSADQVAERAELATYIQGHIFPAHKEALVESAQQENAPQPVINLLKKLPGDQEFEHFQEVWDAVPH